MRVVIVSMNKFGHACLEQLIMQGESVVAIITLAEEYAQGISDYKSFDPIALMNKIPLHKIKNINSPESISLLQELAPDALFVFGWSQIVKEEVIAIPRLGAFGTHPVMLPKNRGRAAIPWQIINNEKESAVSLFYLSNVCDAGDLAGQERFSLTEEDDASTFYDKVCTAGIVLMRNIVPLISQGRNQKIKQDESRATYLHKRTPLDGIIDWSWTEKKIYDLIRATTHPYPGAFTYFQGKKLVIWKAKRLQGLHHQGVVGQVLMIVDEGVVVQAGEGHILLTQVQWEDGDVMPSNKFFKKVDVKLGSMPVTTKKILGGEGP